MTVPAEPAADRGPAVPVRPAGAAGRRRLPRPGLLGGVCLAVVAVLFAAAALGGLVFPHWARQDLLLGVSGPGAGHPLGTDDLGRDILQTAVVGTRSALVGPTLIAVGSMALGNLLGLWAGYRGGWADALVGRWADLVLSLPALLVTVVVVGVLGGGYPAAVLVLAVLSSPTDTRLVRSAVLAQRHLPYVEAAEALGLSRRRILFGHIWPNVLPQALANALVNFSFALVALSSLSFLGIGVPPGAADWGRMLSENQTLMYDNPAATLLPALLVVTAATAVNLLGDRAQDALDLRARTR
ncbi:ABC transporter permease [Streptomyces shenzhenensis]|uniref:ABC transporter permease n=1 Tax=Streptomyces shenzhenensis TaxID=943815 RepID=UPI001F38BB70|nr:ABC transporter permease [Streptomyces shenzhenensis]